MNMHLYLSFVVLISILAFTPGPNVFLMIKYGLEHHVKDALFTVPGICLGLLTYTLLVAVGLAQLIVLHPVFYDFIRIAGAFYLVYMGASGLYKIYFSKDSKDLNKDPCSNKKFRSSLFVSGYLCALTNPKVIVIYLVFFSQFVDRKKDLFVQFITLGVTHVFIVACSMIFYCILANKAQKFVKKYSRIQMSVTNVILISLGVFLLTEKSVLL